MIVFDIGNTDTVIGFFEGENIINKLRIRSLKNENSIYFEYRILNFMLENNIEKRDLLTAVISSVVPILTPFFVNFCEKFLAIKPIVVIPAKSGLLQVNIDMPEELGSDLFVNSLAAFEFVKSDCVVVDFGTALTFTLVSEGGSIEGVTILPGIKTAIKSLFSQTSLLPEVRLEKPSSIIGKNSMHSIQAGIIYGYESMVLGILSKIKSEIGKPLFVYGTGGLSAVLKDISSEFDRIDIDLTIKGLYLYGKKTQV
ncbi:type III pantothenate kinase [Lacihabitans sp. CCS-44]|uniref:type III pantothenate kinase n=1 Tax=Lacihabitans sp. CCS-44 TaxID=2487331 RepID=UPI0020CE1D04|nr:type III pantothenate kinase [Lacihabitans sp. CCS-44]MCP9753647.1 type III pantothenate kinase [Lacihabitans sp. CCS-44]